MGIRDVWCACVVRGEEWLFLFVGGCSYLSILFLYSRYIQLFIIIIIEIINFYLLHYVLSYFAFYFNVLSWNGKKLVHPIYKLSTLCLHVLTFSCEIFMLTVWSTHAGWLQVNEDFFTIIAQVLCEGSWRQYSWYFRRCKWSGIMKIHCTKYIFWLLL